MSDDGAKRDVGRASDDVAAVNAELSSWDGANAIVLGSGLSHRHLKVDLWKEGNATQLVVLCPLPQYYCGPLRWLDAHVRVIAVAAEDKVPFAAEFELRDESAGVRLIGADVHLIEEPAISWRRGAAAG